MNLIEYAENIITNGKIQLVDCDGETIAMITHESPLFCAEHWISTKYYGCNLYTIIGETMVLLETYDDTDEITGRELGANVIENIKNAITAGASYYVIPSN